MHSQTDIRANFRSSPHSVLGRVHVSGSCVIHGERVMEPGRYFSVDCITIAQEPCQMLAYVPRSDTWATTQSDAQSFGRASLIRWHGFQSLPSVLPHAKIRKA